MMPDNEPAAFTSIRLGASCPFASRARVRASLPYRGVDARAAGVQAFPDLAQFTRNIDVEELDGFLVELTDPLHGRSVGILAATLREVVAGLLEAAGVCPTEALAKADDEHWWLTLLGTRWFVLTFAPCYPAASPRATLGTRSTFVLLQPVASFDRHSTPRGTTIPDQVRRAIQSAYADSGRPYDTELAMQNVESMKFVWPLPGEEDHPVPWWQARSPGTGAR